MMRPPPIAVFDLDGTLADTASDLIHVLNVVMAREGLPGVPAEEARDMISAGSRALVARGFEIAGRELTPAHAEELFAVFLDLYADRLCVDTRLFPGVEDALDRLEASGFRLAVCTNKLEMPACRLLDLLGIGSRFAAICGRDTFPWYKPDPRHLTLTIEAAGGDLARAVMIGDSKTDIDTAKAAGVPVVAVPFGYTEIPVADLAPDAIATSFGDVPAAVMRLVGVQASAATAEAGGRDRD